MRVTRRRQIALVLLAATWGALYAIDRHLAIVVLALVVVVVLAVWALDWLGWWP